MKKKRKRTMRGRGVTRRGLVWEAKKVLEV
jgi:hypothetical protein